MTPFVQKTGCKVHVRTVHSSTELLDAVDSGGYDGVAAFGDVTQVLTGGHEVQPIDTGLVPNYDAVYPVLKTLPQNLEHAGYRSGSRRCLRRTRMRLSCGRLRGDEVHLRSELLRRFDGPADGTSPGLRTAGALRAAAGRGGTGGGDASAIG